MNSEVPFVFWDPLKDETSSVSCCKSKTTIYSSTQGAFYCGYAGKTLRAPKLEDGTYACSFYFFYVSQDLQSFNDHCTKVFKGETKDAGKCANNVRLPDHAS